MWRDPHQIPKYPKLQGVLATVKMLKTVRATHIPAVKTSPNHNAPRYRLHYAPPHVAGPRRHKMASRKRSATFAVEPDGEASAAAGDRSTRPRSTSSSPLPVATVADAVPRSRGLQLQSAACASPKDATRPSDKCNRMLPADNAVLPTACATEGALPPCPP